MSEEMEHLEKRRIEAIENIERLLKAAGASGLDAFHKSLYSEAFCAGSLARGETFAISKRIVEAMK